MARQVDARFFSAPAASATAPAGLLSYTPGSATPTPNIARAVGAIEAISAEGGVANAIFINSADLTALRLEAIGAGFSTDDPTVPGVERISGATLYPAPLAAGTAVVADTRFIAVAIRRDASVDFSEDAAFSRTPSYETGPTDSPAPSMSYLEIELALKAIEDSTIVDSTAPEEPRELERSSEHD